MEEDFERLVYIPIRYHYYLLRWRRGILEKKATKEGEEGMDLISCKHCKRKIEKDFDICPFCLGNLKVEQTDMIFCRYCGQKIKKDSHNCPYCGKELLKKKLSETGTVTDETVLFSATTNISVEENNPFLCPSCGAQCKSTQKFCKNCGTKLQ